MSEKTEKIELKPATLAVSEQIRKLAETDKKTGATTVPVAAFEAVLATKHDGKYGADDVKNILNVVKEFGAGSIHAAGVIGVPILAKNKDLAETTFTAELPGSNNAVNVGVRREKQSFNPQDRDNPIITYGATDFHLQLSAGKAKSGEIGRARKFVSNLAAAEFSA